MPLAFSTSEKQPLPPFQRCGPYYLRNRNDGGDEKQRDVRNPQKIRSIADPVGSIALERKRIHHRCDRIHHRQKGNSQYHWWNSIVKVHASKVCAVREREIPRRLIPLLWYSAYTADAEYAAPIGPAMRLSEKPADTVTHKCNARLRFCPTEHSPRTRRLPAFF